jgi:DNA-binding NarL/FixJ family response regulator
MIADDHPVMLYGIAGVLETMGYTIVARAQTADSAIEAMDATQIDIALLDLEFGADTEGIRLGRHLKRVQTRAKAVIFTNASERTNGPLAYRAGLDGWLSKALMPADLRCGIERTMTGVRHFSPDVISVCDDRANSPLSIREQAVYRHLARGVTDYKEIACEMHVSNHTVNTHLKHIRAKMGLTNRSALLQYAVAHPSV